MNKLFDDNGFAIKTCRVRVYNYSKPDNEYISTSMEHVVEGSGIPALSTLTPVNSDKDGFTQVFDPVKNKWEYVEDHRYDDVYNTQTKQLEKIAYLGPLHENHTLLAPPSPDHDFINGEWVITKEKEESLKKMELEMELSKLQQELDDVDKQIVRLERIRDRTEEEDNELEELCDKSTELYREIKSLETKLN